MKSQDTIFYKAPSIEVNASSLRLDSILQIRVLPLFIQSSKNTQLDDFLKRIPGVFSSDRSNVALGERFSIRGSGWQSAFGVRGVQVYFEDLPLTTIDGQTMMEIIDPQRISKINVLRGSTASLFGNSSGGLIQFENAYKERTQFGIKTASFNLNSSEISQVGKTKSGGMYHLSNSITSSSGFRQHSKSMIYRLGFSQKEQVGDQWWTFGAYVLSAPEIENPGALTETQFRENPKQAHPLSVINKAGKVIQHQALTLSIRDESDWNVSLFTQHRTIDNPLAFGWIDLKRWYSGIQFDKKRNTHLGTWTLLSDASFQHDLRENYENNGGFKGDLLVNQQEILKQISFGTKHSTSLLNTLILENSVRFSMYFYRLNDSFFSDGDQSGERNFFPLAFSSTAKWNSVYVSWKNSYDLPTTTELTNRPDGSPGFNPNLNSEQSSSFEIGALGEWKKWKYSFACYQTWVNQLKVGYESTNQIGRTVYKNEGSGTFLGFDTYVESPIVLNQQIILTYSLIKSDFKSSLEKRFSVPGLPNYAALISYLIKYKTIQFLIESQFTGEQYAENENQIKVDSWNVISSQFNITLFKTSLFMRVSNIFDKKYAGSISINANGGRFYEPSAGRHFMLGLSYLFE